MTEIGPRKPKNTESERYFQELEGRMKECASKHDDCKGCRIEKDCVSLWKQISSRLIMTTYYFKYYKGEVVKIVARRNRL